MPLHTRVIIRTQEDTIFIELLLIGIDADMSASVIRYELCYVLPQH